MKKPLFRILKWIGIALLALAGIFLTIQIWFYFTAPLYIFDRPGRFSGAQWYNPYAGMDSTQWKKANFHFHTRKWMGLTSGRNNSNEELWRVYKMLGYDVPMISNYQQISRFNQDSSWYLGCYEHGYGFRKTHQLLLGAQQVLWRDYSLSQNLNHRQHIINLLRKQNGLVVLAHPGWDNGYPAQRIGLLSNYDLLEAINGNYRSLTQWDSVLSAGRPVFLLADDDAHDIQDPGEIGVCMTFVNTPDIAAPRMMEALRAGRSYGMDVSRSETSTWEKKTFYHNHLMPSLKAVEVKNDTLRVRVSEKAMKIIFTGQGGVVKKETSNKAEAWYALQKEDTYIRTHIIFYTPKKWAGTEMFLNPVFRYSGRTPVNVLTSCVNVERTWIFRILTFGSIALFGVVIVRLRQLRRKRDTEA